MPGLRSRWLSCNSTYGHLHCSSASRTDCVAAVTESSVVSHLLPEYAQVSRHSGLHTHAAVTRTLFRAKCGVHDNLHSKLTSINVLYASIDLASKPKSSSCACKAQSPVKPLRKSNETERPQTSPFFIPLQKRDRYAGTASTTLQSVLKWV